MVDLADVLIISILSEIHGRGTHHLFGLRISWSSKGLPSPSMILPGSVSQTVPASPMKLLVLGLLRHRV